MKYVDCSTGCKGGWCKGDGWECVPDSQVMEDALREQQRAKVEAQMASLDFEPEREDLKDWLDATPVLARIQRRKMLERYEQGGTVDELIEAFKKDYELDESQLDSWYASIVDLMDDYQERLKFMQSQ